MEPWIRVAFFLLGCACGVAAFHNACWARGLRENFYFERSWMRYFFAFLWFVMAVFAIAMAIRG